jgi:thiamine biosynthesis lipoprotein
VIRAAALVLLALYAVFSNVHAAEPILPVLTLVSQHRSAGASAPAGELQRRLKPARYDHRESGWELAEREAYLMGTRVRMAVYATRRNAGLATLESALSVLEQAERDLSTWRTDSAISALNRTPVGTPWRASGQLCRMFAPVYEWHAASGGTFDPAIGALTSAWKIHEGGRVPLETEIAEALLRSGLTRLDFNREDCTLTRRADVTLDVGAFGKGEALDRVAVELGPGPWMIDLGGQVAVGGPIPGGEAWSMDIAHPVERHQPYREVSFSTGSLSTSGASERDLFVNGRRVGHHLDPRTGTPAPFVGSVTVWHERALVADILSTALYVMGPEEGIRWAEARGLHACYLIPEGDGVRMAATTAFRRLVSRGA